MQHKFDLGAKVGVDLCDDAGRILLVCGIIAAAILSLAQLPKSNSSQPNICANIRGLDGRDGRDGCDGYVGLPGRDGRDGQAGQLGPRGEPGPAGGIREPQEVNERGIYTTTLTGCFLSEPTE